MVRPMCPVSEHSRLAGRVFLRTVRLECRLVISASSLSPLSVASRRVRWILATASTTSRVRSPSAVTDNTLQTVYTHTNIAALLALTGLYKKHTEHNQNEETIYVVYRNIVSSKLEKELQTQRNTSFYFDINKLFLFIFISKFDLMVICLYFCPVQLKFKTQDLFETCYYADFSF